MLIGILLLFQPFLQRGLQGNNFLFKAKVLFELIPFRREAKMKMRELLFLKRAKTLWSFGPSEWKRVNKWDLEDEFSTEKMMSVKLAAILYNK